MKGRLSLAWDKFAGEELSRSPSKDAESRAVRRRTVAVVEGQTWADVKRNGVTQTRLPQQGPWSRTETLNGVYLTDTYGLCLALTYHQSRPERHQPILMVEVDLDRLNPIRFVPDATMDHQLVMLAKERGFEALEEQGLNISFARQPHNCLEHFGTVWHQSTVPPDAVLRAVALHDLGSKWYRKIPARFASITSFKGVRGYFRPLHEWIIDGAPGVIPLTVATDKAILSEEAEWFRLEMSDAIRESLDVLTW